MLTSVLRHAELKLKRTLGLALLPEIRRVRRRSMVRKLPRVTSRDSRQQAPSSTTMPLLSQCFIAGVISFWRTKDISIARCKCKKISSPSKIQVWWLVFFFANDLFVHVFDSFSMSLSTSRTTARKPRPSQTLSGSANTAACT